MDYDKQEIDNMNEKELRMYKASLRQTLISKRENLRREQERLDKEELDNKYLSRQKEQINEDIETREGKMKMIDNDIYLLEENLKNNRQAKKGLEMDIIRLKKQSSDIDYQTKNKNRELEELRYEIRELTQDIRRLESETREI